MFPSSQAGKPAGNGLARLSIGQEQKSKRERTIESIPPKEEPVKKGKSRAFERVRKQLSEELGEELESLEYTVSDIEEQTELAVKFVEENPEQAHKIALGIEKPPQDILESAISIAYAAWSYKEVWY